MDEEREVITPARTVVVHVPESRSLSGKPVPQSVVDGIIELRLQGQTTPFIAAQFGLDRKTVEDHWRKYLRERAAQRVEDTEAAFADLIERLNQNALDARAGYYRSIAADSAHSESHGVKYLAAERQALDSLARLGVERDDAPMQAARIQAAQATVLAGLIRDVVGRSDLTPTDKAALMTEFSNALRGLTDSAPMVIAGEVQ